MKSDEVLQILKNASEALSHASYCAITGAKVNRGEIIKAWDPLRDLISRMAPDNSFLEPTDKRWIEPTLKVVEVENKK